MKRYTAAQFNEYMNANGERPLFAAARKGDVKLISQLLEQGCAPNLADSKTGRSFYTYAKESGNQDILDVLHQAELSVLQKDDADHRGLLNFFSNPKSTPLSLHSHHDVGHKNKPGQNS